jgi:hypothetical protein
MVDCLSAVPVHPRSLNGVVTARHELDDHGALDNAAVEAIFRGRSNFPDVEAEAIRSRASWSLLRREARASTT